MTTKSANQGRLRGTRRQQLRPTATPEEDVAQDARAARTVRVVIYIGVLLSLNLFLGWTAPDGVPPWRLAFASGLMWLCALPMLIWAGGSEREAPFLPLVTVGYFVYFGLPVFTGVLILHRHNYEPPEVTDAVAITLAGVAMLLVGYYSPLGGLVRRLPRLKMRFELKRYINAFLIGTVLLLIMPVLLTYANVPVRIRAYVFHLSNLPVALLCGLLLAHLRGHLSAAQRLVFFSELTLLMLIHLGKGSLANPLRLSFALLFVYILERRTVPWKTLIILAMALLPFMATKHEFRERAWGRTDLNPVEHIVLFMEITYERVSTGEVSFVDAARISRDRISYLATFSYVVRHTPSRIPYWGGETYELLPWIFVPRILVPDKPAFGLGQRFGHRYSLLHTHDDQTSFNCPQLVEMFANFGHWGVVIGMLIVGLFYRALNHAINHRVGGDGMVIIAGPFLAGLSQIESNAALVLAGSLQNALALYVMLAAFVYLAARLQGEGEDEVGFKIFQ